MIYLLSAIPKPNLGDYPVLNFGIKWLPHSGLDRPGALVLIFVVGVFFLLESSGVVRAAWIFKFEIPTESCLSKMVSITSPPIFNRTNEIQATLSAAYSLNIFGGQNLSNCYGKRECPTAFHGIC